jgi:predicted  nucleic acid-binding Zn-ribbon protein
MTTHHHDYLIEVAGYVGKCADFLLNHMEHLMSAESGAAKQEIASLKADIASLEIALNDYRAATAAAVAAADDDKQALIDLQAEAAAMRQQIASLIATADATTASATQPYAA